MSKWQTLLRGRLSDRAWRGRALAGFVVLAALGNVRSLRAVRQYYAADRPADQVALAIERFAPLRDAAPAGSVLGYFGDTRWNAAERAGAFDRARFALAPLSLVYGVEQELVVGDFPNGEPPGLPPYLQLIADHGQGVRLYRNTGVH